MTVGESEPLELHLAVGPEGLHLHIGEGTVTVVLDTDEEPPEDPDGGPTPPIHIQLHGPLYRFETDRTIAEIEAAVQSGRPVVLRLSKAT